MGTAQTISFLLRRIGSHGAGVERARRIATFPLAGQKQVVTFLETHSTLGAQFAGRIGLDEAASWDTVLDAGPSLARRVEGPDPDDVLQAIADLVDLKSPYLAGHSRAVANLAGEAARVSGLSGDEVVAGRGPPRANGPSG
jgi:HD-GYP domain-containing protein (c-di-GMP phosphodiesterase class II)